MEGESLESRRFPVEAIHTYILFASQPEREREKTAGFVPLSNVSFFGGMRERGKVSRPALLRRK
jgi:hypothetical protein